MCNLFVALVPELRGIAPRKILDACHNCGGATVFRFAPCGVCKERSIAVGDCVVYTVIVYGFCRSFACIGMLMNFCRNMSMYIHMHIYMIFDTSLNSGVLSFCSYVREKGKRSQLLSQLRVLEPEIPDKWFWKFLQFSCFLLRGGFKCFWGRWNHFD